MLTRSQTCTVVDVRLSRIPEVGSSLVEMVVVTTLCASESLHLLSQCIIAFTTAFRIALASSPLVSTSSSKHPFYLFFLVKKHSRIEDHREYLATHDGCYGLGRCLLSCWDSTPQYIKPFSSVHPSQRRLPFSHGIQHRERAYAA